MEVRCIAPPYGITRYFFMEACGLVGLGMSRNYCWLSVRSRKTCSCAFLSPSQAQKRRHYYLRRGTRTPETITSELWTRDVSVSRLVRGMGCIHDRCICLGRGHLWPSVFFVNSARNARLAGCCFHLSADHLLRLIDDAAHVARGGPRACRPRAGAVTTRRAGASHRQNRGRVVGSTLRRFG